MNNYRFLFLTVLLALVGIVTSCEMSDQYLPEDVSQLKGMTVTFSVTKETEDNSTKVAYTSPTSNQLVWTSGDQIGLYGYFPPMEGVPDQNVYNHIYTLQESSVNSRVGDFIGNEDYWAYYLRFYDIYVYYPYTDKATYYSEDFEVETSISALQYQSGPNMGDNLSANKFMFGSLLDYQITSSSISILGMKNLASTIRFTATELAADERITAITLSPNTGNADLAYEGTFNLRTEQLTINEGSSAIRLEIGGGGLTNDDVAYMLVNTGFAGRTFNFYFEITSPSRTRPSIRAATKNNQTGTGKTTSAFDYPNGFRPNVILDVSLSGKHSPELIADEQVWAREYTKDLNAGKGRANCYVVSTNGKFKFNVSYPGNSTLESDKFNLSGATAYLVWQSEDNLITVNSQISAAGNVQIITNGETGNAVVGIRKNGQTLWSWHIWITETGTVDAFSIEGKGTFQSLNLGATSSNLSDPKSYGMYYQWGRKDPFFNSSIFSWSRYGSATLANTIKNPQTVYDRWDGNDTNDQWGNQWNYNIRDNSWGSFGNKEFQTGDLPIAKSKYDPCPYGYRVPTTDEWPVDPQNYFPRGGYGQMSFTNHWHDEGNGYYWSDLAQSGNMWWASNTSFRFGFGPSSKWNTVVDTRNQLMSVRCVEDNR